MKLIGTLLIVVTVFGVIACNTDKICSDTNPSPGVVVEFYRDTLNKKTGELDTFKFSLPDTLVVKGIGTDSLVVDSLRSVQRIVLPLNNNAQTSTFTFVINKLNPASKKREITKDTLKIDYEGRRAFVSQECGFKFDFTIKNATATQNRFKNSVTQQTDITNEASTALYIYFK
ncbi:DUF6452 family protein [Solitalea canadensis]|uniref:Lipoprotein n=1 Tax=Solitalea canadensis (strain ATCC 29591 / DSM 3403 / JCM 21819 / LMG 8368 / NBRC 15130 / NCIMB 12057 / USAM 9D) TaxID=929556 RepID=H8KW64_SOLCM|nr:DUF6452 family protein [Solitalea canadensis]AFD07085.1 hypothetical protein Solca_2030 [Solitalea canadensis DSM 3403]